MKLKKQTEKEYCKTVALVFESITLEHGALESEKWARNRIKMIIAAINTYIWITRIGKNNNENEELRENRRPIQVMYRLTSNWWERTWCATCFRKKPMRWTMKTIANLNETFITNIQPTDTHLHTYYVPMYKCWQRPKAHILINIFGVYIYILHFYNARRLLYFYNRYRTLMIFNSAELILFRPFVLGPSWPGLFFPFEFLIIFNLEFVAIFLYLCFIYYYYYYRNDFRAWIDVAVFYFFFFSLFLVTFSLSSLCMLHNAFHPCNVNDFSEKYVLLLLYVVAVVFFIKSELNLLQCNCFWNWKLAQCTEWLLFT